MWVHNKESRSQLKGLCVWRGRGKSAKNSGSANRQFQGKVGDSPIKAIRLGFIIVNYISLLFISFIILYTTNLVNSGFNAYELIRSIHHIPVPPIKLIVITQILFFLIVVSIYFRSRRLKDSPTWNLILSVVDIFLAVLILYYINLSHKGILFLIISNTMVYIKGRRRKFALLTFSILLYIFLDFDIISSRISLYSLNGYLNYYDADLRFFLFGIRSLLFSVNEGLFIVFMILEVQSFLEETRRVKELNKALFESSEKLRITNIQMKEYSVRNEEMAKLKERNRLAREIHDTIGHYLTAMDLGVKTCLLLVKESPELLKGHLEKVNSLTQRSLVDVRRSIKELQPDTLSRYSLFYALEELSKEISQVSRTKVLFSVDGESYKLTSQLEELIYSVVQEGITNAVRHGAAQNIRSVLSYNNDGIKLIVENDGESPIEITPGFGLSHLQKKVEEFSGCIKFGPGDSKGFYIDIFIPLTRRENID